MNFTSWRARSHTHSNANNGEGDVDRRPRPSHKRAQTQKKMTTNLFLFIQTAHNFVRLMTINRQKCEAATRKKNAQNFRMLLADLARALCFRFMYMVLTPAEKNVLEQARARARLCNSQAKRSKELYAMKRA